MLRSLLDKFASPIRIDPCAGNDALRQAVNALRLGNVKPAIALLQATLDPDQRQGMMDAMCEPPVRISVLERAASEPSAPYEAKLLHAVMSVTHAWEARGEGWEPQNYPEFQRRLEVAGQRLAEVSHLKPKDPVPWISLLNVAKGRELGDEVMVQTFTEGSKVGPTCYGLHESFRDSISVKWGGTPGVADAFVSNTCRAAPPGSHLHALSASHAVEGLIVYLQMQKGHSPASYFRQERVQERLRHTEKMFLDHPKRQASPVEWSARNDLAFGHWLGGNVPQAKIYLQKLKEEQRFHEYPWGFVGPHLKVIRDALRECGM